MTLDLAKYEVPRNRTIISFSGGRTSGYMLWQILQAFGGSLPSGVHCVFTNTGRERERTLDFVHEVGERWSVPIVWLEYCNSLFMRGEGDKRRLFYKHEFRHVSHATASRKGEPFSAMIEAKKHLPNPVMRFCTFELKIQTKNRYCKSLGWETHHNCVGIRADEPKRIAKLLKCEEKEGGEITLLPLAYAGSTLNDVERFWRSQPFDLGLSPGEGNCDLCFLKGEALLQRLIRERPQDLAWWADQEARIGATFRKDRRYVELPMIESPCDDNLADSCNCTD